MTVTAHVLSPTNGIDRVRSRVAILTDADFADVDETTTMLRAVLAHAPSDLTPCVYTLGGHGYDERRRTTLPSVNASIPFWGPMHVPRLDALCDRFLEDDVTAFHMTTSGPAGLVARWLARRLDRPLIGSYHPEVARQAGWWRGARSARLLVRHEYERWLFSACTRVLVPCGFARQSSDALGGMADRLRVWSRGVDGDRFAPDRRSGSRRAKWQVSDNRPAIFCAGAFSDANGASLIGRIITLLAEYRVPHRFVISADDATRCIVEALVPEAIVVGRTSADELAEIMASCDFFVCLDGKGGHLLEAQASGLPVLAQLPDDLQNDMKHQVTGYICRPGSERDFCCRITELILDGRRRTAMGAAARKFALSRGWGDGLAPLFETYREVVRLTDHSAAGAAFDRSPRRAGSILDSPDVGADVSLNDVSGRRAISRRFRRRQQTA